MKSEGRLVRVFVSSPSDLKGEREVSRRVVGKLAGLLVEQRAGA